MAKSVGARESRVRAEGFTGSHKESGWLDSSYERLLYFKAGNFGRPPLHSTFTAVTAVGTAVNSSGSEGAFNNLFRGGRGGKGPRGPHVSKAMVLAHRVKSVDFFSDP